VPSLTQTLAPPATIVGCVRVETVTSPSWVAWKEIEMVTAPMRPGALRPRSPRAWQAIPFLLGAEATSLLVWRRSGFQDPWSSGVDDLASVLLEIAPQVLTILVALVFGWIGRRPAPTLALVGLTLVGPVLIMVQESVNPPRLQGLGGLLAGLLALPACTAAAAGLVAVLRGGLGRGYALLAGGGVVGFLALALPMWALGVGDVAECPAWCDPLYLRGIVATAIIVGVIGLVSMTLGFAIGALIGRWLRDPSGWEST
jgi:hypothetical protein